MSEQSQLESFDGIEATYLKPYQVYRDEQGEPLQTLEPISRINIFIGSNNSGKSRFLRQLSRDGDCEVRIRGVAEARATLLSLFPNVEEVFARFGAQSFGSFNLQHKQILDKALDVSVASIRQDTYAEARNALSMWNVSAESGANVNLPEGAREAIWSALNPLIDEGLEIAGRLPVFSEKTIPVRVYIPTLRGLRRFAVSTDDHYFIATKSAYFPDITCTNGGDASTPANLEIYTGLAFFNKLRALRLGRTVERRSVEGYEKFLSETFFDGSAVELVPSETQEVVTIKLGKDTEQPIHNLGDGIQSAIILSFLPHVLRDTPAFFFIEEPEMCMHPASRGKCSITSRHRSCTDILLQHTQITC